MISSIAQVRNAKHYHQHSKRFDVSVETVSGGHDPGAFFIEIKRQKGVKI